MARNTASTINDSAGVQELIPAIITPDVVATSARQEVFMPLARRLDLTGPGDDYAIPQAGALTFGSFTPAAAITPPTEQAFNTNARTLTPALRVCDVIVPINVIQSTQMSLQDLIVREAGLGLAQDHDAGFAALYTEAPASAPDHEIATGGALTYANSIVAGQALLWTQNAPKPFCLVVHPTYTPDLLVDELVVNASKIGTESIISRGTQNGGFLVKIIDCEVYQSDQIVSSTTYRCMMFSKNAALAYGFKRLQHPVTGDTQELLLDIDWNSANRAVEMNMTYWADWEGAKGTSTTTNTWLVEITK